MYVKNFFVYSIWVPCVGVVLFCFVSLLNVRRKCYSYSFLVVISVLSFGIGVLSLLTAISSLKEENVCDVDPQYNMQVIVVFPLIGVFILLLIFIDCVAHARASSQHSSRQYCSKPITYYIFNILFVGVVIVSVVVTVFFWVMPSQCVLQLRQNMGATLWTCWELICWTFSFVLIFSFLSGICCSPERFDFREYENAD
jgi:hypothetical protein